MESNNDFEENLNVIKKFYTYLGNFIDVGEYNDPEEVTFLAEYLNEYDDAYDEWYNESEHSESEHSENETENGTEFNFDNVSESSTLSEDSNTDENPSFQYEFKQFLNKEEENKINELLSESFNSNDILLYRKNSNLQNRCDLYTKSIYKY
jgi:hypothetical protein